MTKFVVSYDKNVDFSTFQTELINAGCIIHENLTFLCILIVECNNESFASTTGIIHYEPENEITITENWHKLRISSIALPVRMLYLTRNLGLNSIVYLVDSGVDTSHSEFTNSNITHLWSWDGTTTDTNGHGTSMASLIVGSTLGVSPDATLKSVKIPFGTTITTSVLLNAFNAILADHLLTPDVKVINCSWSIPKSSILDTKIIELQSHGLVVVAAAGNDMINADTLSPVGLNSVLGVASSDAYDRVIAWAPGTGSNWGPDVDITAPGIDVDVAMIDGTIQKKSGTSISSAIVSGVVCQFITEYADMTAIQIQEAIQNNSIPDILFRNESIYGTTPNLLVYTLSIKDSFLTPLKEERIINLQRGTVIEIPITYTNIINSLNIHNISLGSRSRTAPQWVSLTDDTLVVSPPADLPIGKYRIFIEGLSDGVSVQAASILFKIYDSIPSENDTILEETYFVLSDNGTEIIIKQSVCGGGCNPGGGDTCSAQAKGCGCGVGSSCQE